MKTNCKTLKISIIISSVLFGLTVIFIFIVLNSNLKIYEIVLNIFVGLFGSSCVALMLAIPAYLVSKKQLLERLWFEARRMVDKFYDIPYLYSEFDKETLVSYINEKNNKYWEDDFNRLSNKKKRKEKDYFDLLLKNNIDYNKKMYCLDSKEISKEQFIEATGNSIESIRSNVLNIYKQYIYLSEETSMTLNFIMGDIQFISGEKYYNFVYNNVYKPILNRISKIKDISNHFTLFLNGEGNEAVCLDLLLDFQKEIFSIKEIEKDNEVNFSVYNKFADDMSIELEKLRSLIYNEEPDMLDLYPVETKIFYKIKN